MYDQCFLVDCRQLHLTCIGNVRRAEALRLRAGRFCQSSRQRLVSRRLSGYSAAPFGRGEWECGVLDADRQQSPSDPTSSGLTAPALSGERKRQPDHTTRDPACGVRSAGAVPAGTVVTVTSVNRLAARSSHSAAYVEAPAPEHTHEAQTSERTMTSAWRRHRFW